MCTRLFARLICLCVPLTLNLEDELAVVAAGE